MNEPQNAPSTMDRYLPPEAVQVAAQSLWGGSFDGDPDRVREWDETVARARRALLAATPIIRKAAIDGARAYFLKHNNGRVAGELEAIASMEGLNTFLLPGFGQVGS